MIIATSFQMIQKAKNQPKATNLLDLKKREGSLPDKASKKWH